MKQVIAEAGRVKVVDVPVPECKDTEVLVRSEFSLISTGTETWALDSTKPIGAGELVGDSSRLKKAARLATKVVKSEGVGGLADYVSQVRNPEVPLGYSVSGTVVKIGSKVTDIAAGERVACAGEGFACHAEYVAVPRNLVAKVPDGVGMKEAAFTTLGSIATHGFRRSAAGLGESVAVIGVGLVGNLVVQICRSAGCRVVALDTRKDRLDLALKTGASLAIGIKDPDLMVHISHFTNGRGVDSVIVCASGQTSDPVNLASKLARDRSKVTIVGRVGMAFDRKDYYQKELDVSMSRSLGPGRYDSKYEEQGGDYPAGYVRWTLNRNMEAFLNLLAEKKVVVSELVGEEFEVERAAEAYEALESTPKVALLFRYPGAGAQETATKTPETYRPRTEGAHGFALVGPGNYAKEILLPLLRRDKRFDPRWVVASDPLHGRQTAKRYHFFGFATDLGEPLGDPSTEVVIIAAPNHLHADMVTRSAEAGKAVFVEKPLCITPDELAKLVEVQKKTGARIAVGFNRRYAPLVLKLKELLGKVDGPILINYRANTDLVPPTRWSQDPALGGGRVIHEACHFFDLFNFLTGSQGPRVSVMSTDVNSSTAVARDNFVATMKYPEGSVATLTYSSLGTRAMDRERMEVFAGGHGYVLEDFRRLLVYGADTKEVKLGEQDKGHANELGELYNMLAGRDSKLITFEEGVEAMKTTFEVDLRLRELEAQEKKGASTGRWLK
ncbi:MAG TPA: bi-domain-containing oxidoreductase [Nitrososphaerales archaeon]|nr:bi-domain-containing oxidoreductase [Nitrososphaerales archaeon]